MPEKTHIEIHNEEVREIMKEIPGWIIRWGLTVLFTLFAILIIGSYFFRYPQVVSVPVVITIQNPPAALEAKSSGKIEHLFVSNGDSVKTNQKIVIIETPAKYTDFINLEKQIDKQHENYQKMIEFQLQSDRELNQFQLGLDESYQLLKASLNQWKERYLIESPIDGKIIFTDYLSKNQTVKAGDKIATVVPVNGSEFIGKAFIPVSEFRKIEVGQKVQIKLSGFPYMEFGILTGQIRSLSLVPEEHGYVAEIELTKGTTSSYSEKLKFIQEMDGIAEIITEETRLIYRFINPLKSLFDKDK